MVQIIPRSEWGARFAAGAGPAPLPAREVWLHHSVTIAPDLVPPFDDEYAAMRTLEEIGQQRFQQGISYTFPIMPNGRVYEGHGVARLGAHTGGRNSIARAIVFIGNYDVNRPTPQMIEAAAQLLVDGQREGWWLHARLNGGHQNAPGASTACPGRWAMAVIGQINSRAAAIEAGAPPINLEDDMSAKAEEQIQQLVWHIDGNLTPAITRMDRLISVMFTETAAIRAVVDKLAETVASDDANDLTLAGVKAVVADAIQDAGAALRRVQEAATVDAAKVESATPPAV